MAVIWRILGLLLFPVSIVYCLVTRFRNHLYDIGYKKSFRFEIPVISVGNLSVGGTGKTPMVEYLVRLLKDNYAVAILSRGYGRKTSGFRLASEQDSSKTLGDEPFQYYLKFGPGVAVAVGENRALAIPEILFQIPDTEAVLLDDAYQHRSVAPHFSILLTEYKKPFFKDFLMPTGRLREPAAGAKRTDVIVVTKCPENLQEQECRQMERDIRKYAGENKPIFFSAIKYMQPKAVYKNRADLGKNAILFSGISNANYLESYVSENFNLVKHFNFNDHHSYTTTDIGNILDAFNRVNDTDKCLLTTEKDMVKLLKEDISPLLKGLPVYYLPIETVFLAKQSFFDQLILSSVVKN